MSAIGLPARRMRGRNPLPGFGLSLGLGMAWLGVVVVLLLYAALWAFVRPLWIVAGLHGAAFMFLLGMAFLSVLLLRAGGKRAAFEQVAVGLKADRAEMAMAPAMEADGVRRPDPVEKRAEGGGDGMQHIRRPVDDAGVGRACLGGLQHAPQRRA